MSKKRQRNINEFKNQEDDISTNNSENTLELPEDKTGNDDIQMNEVMEENISDSCQNAGSGINAFDSAQNAGIGKNTSGFEQSVNIKLDSAQNAGISKNTSGFDQSVNIKLDSAQNAGISKNTSGFKQNVNIKLDSKNRYGNVRRFRHEYKYMIDMKQEAVLRVKTGGIMTLDPHVRDDGTYLIRSAYFDDRNDTCLKENMSGTDPRSKFRIRYYNSDTSRIALEKKSKSRSMCLKDSCSLTVEECETFLKGSVPIITDDMPEIKKQLFSEVKVRGLYPKVIVTYERIPFIYSGGNVRVTFDRKITSSSDLDNFLTGNYLERPVLELCKSILEVKWDEVMPRHIKDTLRLENLNWTAFSKYFVCRRFGC
jgi:hypothetical protein